MLEICSRAGKLPAPPSVIWESLVDPHRPGARPWLVLVRDEVEPRVVGAVKPHRVVWSSLWPDRPNDEVHLELTAAGRETSLAFTLFALDEPPDEEYAGHLRRRLDHLLFADLRLSYGQ